MRPKQMICKRLLRRKKSLEAFKDFKIVNNKTILEKELLMDADEMVSQLIRIVERRKHKLQKGYL